MVPCNGLVWLRRIPFLVCFWVGWATREIPERIWRVEGKQLHFVAHTCCGRSADTDLVGQKEQLVPGLVFPLGPGVYVRDFCKIPTSTMRSNKN